MALAALPEAAARISGGTTELRRSSVIYMTRTGTYSIAKARRVLGYEPRGRPERGHAPDRGVADGREGLLEPG